MSPSTLLLTVLRQLGLLLLALGMFIFPQRANGRRSTYKEAAVIVEAKVKGTYAPAGQTPAVAEGSVFLKVPPITESFGFDGAGRQTGEAFWNYTWDAAGRMTKKTAKAPLKPGVASETVECVYDADGRRIKKTHRTVFQGGASVEEESTVVWAGDVEICQTLNLLDYHPGGGYMVARTGKCKKSSMVKQQRLAELEAMILSISI